jgi:hypothetical protein
MTVNDTLLLLNFRAARDLYDNTDILVRLETAEHLGMCLTALRWLDDPELNKIARIARLEFDDKDTPKNLFEATKAAEIKLVEAISSIIPE